MPKLTNDKYRKCGGVFCPSCESNDITANNFDIESLELRQSVECLNCGATWDDVYELTGYDDLEEPENG